MKHVGNKSSIGFVVALLIGQTAAARGVTPYLPLKMAPNIERQIERVLILADKAPLRRPIPAALVFDALPEACKYDTQLCEEVTQYLRRYMKSFGIAHLKAEGALTSGDSTATIPNGHGETVDSKWRLFGAAYYQPNDYVLLSAGALAYEQDATPTGSLLSLGFDFAQLDVGYRDHWLSPLYDSSSLVSTNAPTMPSITLSNYEPISRLGLNYEFFAADMSSQEGIVYSGGTTSGRPRLSGMQVAMRPVDGYFFALNRLTQYGGGARESGGVSKFIDAIATTGNAGMSDNGEFGNQVAALTSSISFPAAVPFVVRLEYAAEDNAYASGYRLGATNFSLGVDLPLLLSKFDASFELSEWQNDWYIHHLYPQGLTNSGHVIGHWFGDQRLFGNAIGGNSEMFRVGWRANAANYLQATYRTLAYDGAWSKGLPVPPYVRLHSLGVNWSTTWRGVPFEVEVNAGRDIFGEEYARISGSFDFANYLFADRGTSIDERAVTESEHDIDLFVEAGANRSSVLKFLVIGQQSPPVQSTYGAHAGFGARRAITARSDLGARIEFDEVEENRLISFRALDYRYRFTRKLALGGFFGFGRYEVGLPAYGYYWGAGAQYLNVIPHWDIGFDFRHYEKLNRDKTLPTDPPSSAEGHPRIYFDIDSATLYLTYRW